MKSIICITITGYGFQKNKQHQVFTPESPLPLKLCNLHKYLHWTTTNLVLPRKSSFKVYPANSPRTSCFARQTFKSFLSPSISVGVADRGGLVLPLVQLIPTTHHRRRSLFTEGAPGTRATRGFAIFYNFEGFFDNDAVGGECAGFWWNLNKAVSGSNRGRWKDFFLFFLCVLKFWTLWLFDWKK